ncbi:hypothetical protein K2173_007209 [Erythroxylum novogranatense]|uniref:Disease resistance RPP13-like protein 1 n=1 Tax=Erythroxylum novogranatense TaxID=1862640 RepID=A0AAV8SYM2_9ROSI|nr:hypothetical protein K2173_007209 [Erythroxylum novogranatense]
MAAEAVSAAGGAAVGAFLNVLFDRMASKRFVDFFRRQKLDDRLLQKLKTAMNSVRGVLDDAEEKEITKPAVKQWLDDLKNSFFEADDSLDEIDYEATRLELEAESRYITDEVRKFLCPRKSFKKALKVRLMKILETIEDLVNQKDVLDLREIIGGGQSTQRIPTTSLVEKSSIFGRERDQEAIMQVLLSDDVNRRNNLSIISIVGLGGIGKTTLAQLIYRDERVRNRFDVRGWVCVSEEFDVPRITRDIVKEVAQMSCDDKTLNQIQVELEENLTEKRFLLVLDDVWNESVNYWDQLLKPLKSGAPGSKIIVTTRNDGVATTVSFSSIFRLDMLASTECWQLFCKHAFEDENCGDYPHLEEIGKEIVKRCDGLPLALKVMGGILRSKRNVKDWENVLRNDLWKFSKDDILPVLRLSYRYLPSHLKQCFAYCSIFPKDYKFKKEQLILLWMAEGFLIEQEGSETMEEVGEEYFEELVSRSFFQHVNNSFVMHDLINDLARVVSGEFCFRFENQEFCRTLEKLRYFSCATVKQLLSSRQLSTILKSPHLRTFLPVNNTSWKQDIIPDLLLNQQRLRVLSLPCWEVVKLPSSIRHLKHLRYLDLSRTFIKSLPKCLCSFYNLQTLKLNQCGRLAKLPTKMGRLISMHYLDIEGTNLQEMPPNMGKLIKLQSLTDFFVGKREGCGVKELGSLQHLGGTLRIHNLQNVLNAKDALEAKIKCKKNLKELYLYWKGDHDEEAILDGLQPHTEIEVISITGYGGTSFPNWLGESSFTKLVSLKLRGCKYCSSLPPLGQVSSLKYLEVRGFNEVRVIDSDFYGRCVSAVKPFQSLEIISFKGMPQWQEWRPYAREGESESGAFPCLKLLRVINCPNLKGALPSHLPSLAKLEIGDCPQLQNCVPHAHNLSSIVLSNGYWPHFNSSNSLTIINFQESVLEKIGQLGSSLEEITIAKHEPLMCFPLELFPKLESLRIEECPKFESLCTPNQEFVSFEFLTVLILEDCANLKFLPERMQSLLPALLELGMFNCPEIETFPRDGLPLKLESLAIYNCSKLIVGRMHWDLQKLTSLTSFSITDYEAEEMESFPEVTLLPSVLTSLHICDLANLKSLNYEGLQRFNSLEKLIIRNCPRLQLVSDEGLPSTLTYLEITDIQNLDFLFNRTFHDLTSLRYLSISDCPEIASLPEEGFPPSLDILHLNNLQNLRYVEGLHHLTSLERLTIRRCPHLKTLQEEGLPSSLYYLETWGCPLLRKRYRRKKGKYWAKISHISIIDIS